MDIKKSSDIVFTPGDTLNPLWVKLEQYVNVKIEELHKRNEGGLGEVETAHIRGQIAALRALLGRPKSPPRVTDTEAVMPDSIGGRAF